MPPLHNAADNCSGEFPQRSASQGTSGGDLRVAIAIKSPPTSAAAQPTYPSARELPREFQALIRLAIIKWMTPIVAASNIIAA